MFELSQELLIHSHIHPSGIFVWFPTCLNGPLEEVFPENLLSITLGSAFLKPRVVILIFVFIPFSQDYELYYAAKVAADLHSPNKIFLLCKSEVEQSASSPRLLNDMSEEVTINTLQKHCCVAPLQIPGG